VDQFGPDQAEPRRRIGLACAALRFLVFGPEQVGPGLGEVTRPQPDRGVLPADVSQVSQAPSSRASEAASSMAAIAVS